MKGIENRTIRQVNTMWDPNTTSDMISLHPIKASTPDKTQNQISLFSRAIIKKPKNTDFFFQKDTVFISKLVIFAKVIEYSNNFSFSKESRKNQQSNYQKRQTMHRKPKTYQHLTMLSTYISKTYWQQSHNFKSRHWESR